MRRAEEGFSAGGAFVGFFFDVDPFVVLEGFPAEEGLFACFTLENLIVLCGFPGFSTTSVE